MRTVLPQEQDNGNITISRPELTPSISAMAAALAGAGAGNVNNGQHSYLVTFVTAEGETNFDPEDLGSKTVTVADKTANGKVALSSIPTGSAFVTARKIYRTAAGADTNLHANYELLATISDNTTTTHTDNVADADLGATVPIANTTANKVFESNAATGTARIGAPGTPPEVPATPTAQDIVDALVALGIVTQAAP